MVRNVAVIAHVDHGKTSVVDGLVWQASLLEREGGDRQALAALLDPERAKEIGIMPRRVELGFDGLRVTLLDTPAQDLSGETERALSLADGLLYVVDAVDGPVPQTRFALRQALAAGLAPIVFVNKIDMPGARPEETIEAVRREWRDLEASEAQLVFPVMLGTAHRGRCAADAAKAPGESLLPLLEAIRERIPAPAEEDGPFRMTVADLGFDDFLGRTCIGKIGAGRLAAGDAVVHTVDGEACEARVEGIYGFDGTRREQRDAADAGAIVDLTGIDPVSIGDVLVAPGSASPSCGSIRAPQPTIGVSIAANDSPLAGVDGGNADADALRQRLWLTAAVNPSIRLEQDGAGSFRISGSGELQLVILFEVLRREGFEVLLGPPEVLVREVDGERQEPHDQIEIDCPTEFADVVQRKVERRHGRLTRMVDHGTGRTRLDFVGPTRALLGLRAELLHDTRGTGLLSHRFHGFAPAPDAPRDRATGSLVADRDGNCSAFALRQLQHHGSLFVAPGEEVYAGRIVGESTQEGDRLVNVTKAKPGGEPGDRAAEPLLPPRLFSLDQALGFLAADERVEVSPTALRLRKRVLPGR